MDGSCAADVARRTMRVAVATTQNHWDRLQSCDHAGYSPPCGACEGVGGIASSDTASDIKIVPCKIEASTVNPLMPIWGGPFTELASHEILIGKKIRVCSGEMHAVVPKTLLEAAFQRNSVGDCSASPSAALLRRPRWFSNLDHRLTCVQDDSIQRVSS